LQARAALHDQVGPKEPAPAEVTAIRFAIEAFGLGAALKVLVSA
jgi:hypothetical protein